MCTNSLLFLLLCRNAAGKVENNSKATTKSPKPQESKV